MTDQATLERLVEEAERELRVATLMGEALVPEAPLKDKVEADRRIERARIELDALFELEPEDEPMTPDATTVADALEEARRAWQDWQDEWANVQ